MRPSKHGQTPGPPVTHSNKWRDREVLFIQDAQFNATILRSTARRIVAGNRFGRAKTGAHRVALRVEYDPGVMRLSVA